MMVDIDGVETKVRLIGVDTPESVATGDNAYKNCEEGKTASNFTNSIVEGKYIYLEYDVDPDDNYGRTLAYVYMEDGQMLNKILLEKGYARMMTIQPNVKYVDYFVAIQREAQANGVGFWSNFEQWQED
jgi:micrococcal nuclease